MRYGLDKEAHGSSTQERLSGALERTKALAGTRAHSRKNRRTLVRLQPCRSSAVSALWLTACRRGIRCAYVDLPQVGKRIARGAKQQSLRQHGALTSMSVASAPRGG